MNKKYTVVFEKVNKILPYLDGKTQLRDVAELSGVKYTSILAYSKKLEGVLIDITRKNINGFSFSYYKAKQPSVSMELFKQIFNITDTGAHIKVEKDESVMSMLTQSQIKQVNDKEAVHVFHQPNGARVICIRKHTGNGVKPTRKYYANSMSWDGMYA
jgi:hypothetical protein